MNKISFISSLVFYIFFLLLFTNCHGGDHPSVQGNSNITLSVKNGKSSELHTLKGNASDLWCQATLDGYTTLPLRGSYFINTNTNRTYFSGHEDEVIKVDIIDRNRTYLRFSNKTSINESGKYVCVLKTEDGQKVHRDLFVYLRPVFHASGSLRLKIEDEKDFPFQITASSTKVLRGETAVLGCPAIGYPKPSITWYKGENKTPLGLKSSERYEFRGNELIIHNVEDTDEEIYRCVASNNFSIDVNGTSLHEATLDQKLWVAKPLSWLTPLLVLLIMLSLLFSIVCVVRIREKKQRNKQYNVVEKEKSLS